MPVAFCVAAAAALESGNAAGSAVVRPTLLPRTFQCAVKILIGVLAFACCIRSAAPDVTHHVKKGVLPGSSVLWAVVPLGIYACFLWEIIRLIKIKEKA